MPADGRSSAAKIRSSSVTHGIRLVLGAAAGVIVARALDPEGRGNLAVITMIATLATTLGHLSLGQANIAFWSTHRDTIPATNLLVAPLLGGAGAVLTGVVVVAVGPDVVAVPDWPLLLVALVSVPPTVAGMHLGGVALLADRTDVFNRSLTVSTLAQCGALLALGVAGRLTVAVVVWIWALTNVLPTLVYVTALRPRPRHAELALARRLIAVASRFHPGFAAHFLLLRIDVLILAALASPAAVGRYSLAVSIAEMATTSTAALAQVALSGQADEGMDRAGAVTASTIRASVAVSVAFVGVLCLAAPVVVPLLYGEPFRASVPALYALAPGVLALSATAAVGPYLARLGRPWLVSGISLFMLGVNVALNLLLIPHWGLVGCALATSAAYLLFAGCRVGWFLRAAALPAHALLPRVADLAQIWQAVRGRPDNAEADDRTAVRY